MSDVSIWNEYPNLDVLLRIFIPVRKTIRKYAYMSYR